MDLFDDLPEPTQTAGEASVQKTCPSPLEDRGAKRKREAPDDDEVVEEQKLEEKKVCLY